MSIPTTREPSSASLPLFFLGEPFAPGERRCRIVVAARQVITGNVSLMIRPLRAVARSLTGLAPCLWRWSVRVTRPSREYAWRWWHYSFREPLASSDEAHEALRRLCGYRLVGGPQRIARVVPGLRRFRFGVRVVVQAERQPSRSWTAQWVRWVDDPLELWLIRSAVSGAGPARPEPGAGTAARGQPSEGGLLDSMSREEMGELLGGPQGEPRMRSALRLMWDGLVGLGWLAVLCVLGPTLMSGRPSPPASGGGAVDGMRAEVPKGAGPVEAQAAPDNRPVARRDMGQAATVTPRRNVPTPANLHNTYRPGEPYPYSLARNRNNELRWTINEFRWRLGDPAGARTYWDLRQLDEPLGGELPERLDDLRRQNWELDWRAEQLHRLLAGLEPQVEMPTMPRGWNDVSIPRPI